MKNHEKVPYPYILLKQGLNVSPLFPTLKGDPLVLDLSETSGFLKGLPIGDPKIFQDKLDTLMAGEFSWGLSAYLENRKTLLADCPQMMEEKRYYHLGLDIIVPCRTYVHTPLAAVVKDMGFEDGKGNYGGYVLLEHAIEQGETFYSLYGHLCPDDLPEKGTPLDTGEIFSCTGDFKENGNWFYHTHMQILTRCGLDEEMQFKGYCTANKLPEMPSLCPDPNPLFFMGTARDFPG